MALPVLEALIRKGPPRAGAGAALCTLLLSAALLTGLTPTARAQATPAADAASSAIAGNPGAVNIVAGTGALGRLLGLDPESGLRLGGVLVSNGNYLISGGNAPDKTSFNNLLLADLDADLDQLAQIPGASFGTALLRFDGRLRHWRLGPEGDSPYRGRKVRSLRMEPTVPTPSLRSGCGAAAGRATREAYRGSFN